METNIDKTLAKINYSFSDNFTDKVIQKIENEICEYKTFRSLFIKVATVAAVCVAILFINELTNNPLNIMNKDLITEDNINVYIAFII